MAAVTALVYSRSVGLGFVAWDDEIPLASNPAFRGLGWEQLRWMAENALLGHWVPLTWLSFALDYAVWGLRPAGYHLTNVLLHAVNAGLAYALADHLLQRATPWPARVCRLGGVAASLLWALHPMRVEAVSWLTGRRDVLSGFFLLLTVLAYVRATETEERRRVWLLASLFTYVLALGSKAVVMVLPAALAALEWYPLGTVGGDATGTIGGAPAPGRPRAVRGSCGSRGGRVVRDPGPGLGRSRPRHRRVARDAHRHAGDPALEDPAPGRTLASLLPMPPLIDLRAPRYWVAALAAATITVAIVVLAARASGARGLGVVPGVPGAGHRRWPTRARS